MYIDTHCHIADEDFENPAEVIEEYVKRGVSVAINMGCDAESSLRGKSLSEKFESVYFAAGFHPSEAEKFSKEEEEKIRGLLSHPKCVAVGEIGLDRHFLPYDAKKQEDCFVRQLVMASEFNLPVSIHMRDATEETLRLLKENKRFFRGGVMHCFSGSVETLKTLLDLGFYIGFGGTVTFKNAKNVRLAAAYVPADRLLTETDSPYLAPEPYRGSKNEPKNVPIIAAFIANLRGEDNVRFANRIMQNAKELFKKL